MIEQPQLAVIRTDAVGADFYDRVMDRIAGRQRRPRGIAVHFAGSNADELFVVTIYRDIEAQAGMFTDFSGPEIINELHESDTRADLSRDEYTLERLWIAESLGPISERPVAKPMFACLLLDGQMTSAAYEASVEDSRTSGNWPEGLQLHAAFRRGQHLGFVELWTSSELAESHSREGRLELHSLTVTLALDDPLRDFAKQPRDPSA